MPIISGVGFNAVSRDGSAESIIDDLEYYTRIGADFVEISLGSFDLVAGGRIIADRLRTLAEITKRYPLKYTLHGLVCSNYMASQTARRQIDVTKAYLEICDRLGAGILVQHSGFVRADEPWDREGADQRELDALVEVSNVAARYGVRVALENIFTAQSGQYRKTPAEVAKTVASLNHPNIVATTDFSHAYIECNFRGLNFLDELRAMAPVSGHLHVHDSFGQQAGNLQYFFPQESAALGLADLHLPLGWGDIAWDSIFSELKFLPNTVLMMEIGRRFRAEQPACLERARKFAEMVNSRA